MVIETIALLLINTAKSGYAAFSKVADDVTKRRKTAKYEADKEKAFQSALLGNQCDWGLLETVVEEADVRGDVSPVANKLRKHVTFSPTAPQRKGRKKKAGPKKASKKAAPKKAGKKATKTTVKKAAKITGKKTAPKKAAKKKAAPKKKTAKRKATKRKAAPRKKATKKKASKKASKRKAAKK